MRDCCCIYIYIYIKHTPSSWMYTHLCIQTMSVIPHHAWFLCAWQMWAGWCVCAYVRTYMFDYTCMYIYIIYIVRCESERLCCMQVCMCICIYVCIRMHVCTQYIHLHLHIHITSLNHAHMLMTRLLKMSRAPVQLPRSPSVICRRFQNAEACLCSLTKSSLQLWQAHWISCRWHHNHVHSHCHGVFLLKHDKKVKY